MIKRLFHALTLRERLLLSAILWIALIFWVTSILARYRDTRTASSTVALELETQEALISNEAAITAALEQARRGLDTGRTYSASELTEKLDTLARSMRLDFDLDDPNTEEGTIFRRHSASIVIDGAEISELIAFDERIQNEAPYLVITGFEIAPQARDPRRLKAEFEVASFELTSPDLTPDA